MWQKLFNKSTNKFNLSSKIPPIIPNMIVLLFWKIWSRFKQIPWFWRWYYIPNKYKKFCSFHNKMRWKKTKTKKKILRKDPEKREKRNFCDEALPSLKAIMTNFVLSKDELLLFTLNCSINILFLEDVFYTLLKDELWLFDELFFEEFSTL